MALFPLIVLGALSILSTPPAAEAAARQCTDQERAEILAKATKQKPSYHVKCSIRLSPKNVITKDLQFKGPASSHVVFDCNNALIRVGAVPRPVSQPMVHVKSVRTKEGKWQRPSNVTIKNCRLDGWMRVTGMALTGEGKYLKASSQKAGHIERAQNAAPTNVTFSNIKLKAVGVIPLYIGPGVTGVTLKNSHFYGKSNSVGIYLDAESARNVFLNNTFETFSKREAIAIDGSAQNTIQNNRFNTLRYGGIYVYRNCGEGGTIRHQKPQRNVINNNFFYYNKFKGIGPSFAGYLRSKSLRVPAIWLGERSGYRPFCDHDKGFPFGSSIDNGNFAENNVITNNKIRKLRPNWMIISDHKSNKIAGNIRVKK